MSRRSFMISTGALVAGATVLPISELRPPMARADASWLADAVLYQIYPQTYADADGTGVGDLQGIIDHLDHLQWLGITAVWMNPIFPSPLTDAGYDVSDYVGVHERYGTQDDVARLTEEARKRGIRILFDLVAGHTSDQHPWFLNSLQDFSDDRFIWASPDQFPDGNLPENFVASPGPREGAFLKNFYDTQPAINYGYARMNPDEPWRQPVDAEGPKRNRAAMREIMDHWLNLGIAGFRCDMAGSLIKDDPDLVETGKLWGEMAAWLDENHPDAVLVSEWGDPKVAVPAGFDGDFFFQTGEAWRSLWQDNPYFGADGTGTAKIFIDAWREAEDAIGRPGGVILPSANHDTALRLNNGIRTPEEIPAAYAFWLTWPIVPLIYYGEEIGMRLVDGLPDVEGSNGRQNNRTPMQWNDGPNAGFSTAPAENLYLPQDPDPNRPNVEAQRDDPGSLLNLVQRLIALRQANPELGTASDVQVFHDGYPLTYLRGDRFLVTVNPSRDAVTVAVPDERLANATAVEDSGVTINGQDITVPAFGYAVLDLR
ncbi:alpha-amylase family glycosyl hydrolase [Saccharopolyspora endophytica]|uniref:Oligo-1,6-glucosidase n=1 Tax=Saccharopolyspora endophytica TaxID=543886 RepID=A0ABS5DKS4_9PSEU|nr:alpha-amylase family glycosyl hydrolase [Saccharopolyspora endophytica]MBQ0926882.1 oligo-1,6-glucosidase [Saccharopolyspora endophytica]